MKQSDFFNYLWTSDAYMGYETWSSIQHQATIHRLLIILNLIEL